MLNYQLTTTEKTNYKTTKHGQTLSCVHMGLEVTSSCVDVQLVGFRADSIYRLVR